MQKGRTESSLQLLKMSDESLNEVLIERLKSYSLKPNDNLEGIRMTAARLHSRTVSQDKGVRDRTLERIWRKQDGAISLILTLLENVRDHLSCCSLAGILHECVSSKAARHRNPATAQLVALNATNLIIKLLIQVSGKETQVADMLVFELVWILAQLSQRDPKFSVKVRLLGSVRTFHCLLRTHHNNPKLLYPLLLLMKALSRNINTVTALVKDGIVSTMEKVLVGVGYSPSPKLRLTLNVVHSLSRSKLCCSRMTRDEFIPVLMRIFERWERYTGKMRLRILTYTVITLKHLSNTRAGRKALKGTPGIQYLYKFCVACPNDRVYDSLLPRVATIIGLCTDKKALPVDSAGPVPFMLPVVSHQESNDSSEQAPVLRKSSSRETTPSEDDSVVDALYDDDNDSDEDGGDSSSDKGVENGRRYILLSPIQRDPEDLKQYNNFFQEILSLNVENNEEKSQKCTPRARSYQELGPHKTRGSDLTDPGPKPSRNGTGQQQKQQQHEQQEPQNPVPSGGESFWHREVARRLNNYLHTVASHTHLEPCTESSTTFGKCSCFDLTTRQPFNSCRALSEPVVQKGTVHHAQMVSNLHILADVQKHASQHYAYCTIASKVKTVHPVVKVAYPDMVGGDGIGKLHPLNVKDRRVCRAKLLSSVERAVQTHTVMDKVVYDVDALLQQEKACECPDERHLYNWDERKVGQRETTKFHLLFESRFESGNLRKAIQVGPTEYDLILMPDVNSVRHHQWFYFEISNMDAEINYTFNIINCEKLNSQFNYGMKPILYSVCEAMLGRPGWVRAGTDICYYRNNFQNTHSRSRSYYLTTSFSVVFPHANDVVYIAYHFPYPYSQLLTQIWKWSLSVDPNSIYFRADSLCMSLNNNETPLLTITSPDMEENRIRDREIVFLTARVHPGESNASWVMHGTIHYLLSNAPAAVIIRNKFVFKIVPMLNMEGVINGCYRCGLSDEDLNRRWSRPNQLLHPVIYHTKGLIEYCTRVLRKTPFMFCDYHGHSRRKNVFFYGCCNAGSWNDSDRVTSDNPVDYLMLPHLMQHFSRAFNLAACNFRVERVRETTARVTVWREFGVRRSYTMESSFCGCDQGYYQGHHLDTIHLKEIGANFCEAMACLKDESTWRGELTVSAEEAARLAGLSISHTNEESPANSELSDSSDSDEEEFD